jgi:predicted RNA-binding protein with PUA-like domain
MEIDDDSLRSTVESSNLRIYIILAISSGLGQSLFSVFKRASTDISVRGTAREKHMFIDAHSFERNLLAGLAVPEAFGRFRSRQGFPAVGFFLAAGYNKESSQNQTVKTASRQHRPSDEELNHEQQRYRNPATDENAPRPMLHGQRVGSKLRRLRANRALGRHSPNLDFPHGFLYFMAYRLLKSDPDTDAYPGLARGGETDWDGVNNNLAVVHVRRTGMDDMVFLYHTDAEKADVGRAQIVPDPFPPKRKDGPKFVAVILCPWGRLRSPVHLMAIKRAADLSLARLSRLSVMPVSATQWKLLQDMSY